MKSHKIIRPGLLVGILPVLLVPALMVGPMPAHAGAATLVVTTTADPGVGGCTASGNGDGCTLREAIIAANNQTLTPGDDTIDATGLSGAITLLTALPPITTNIVLDGPGPATLTVQRSSGAGTPEFRIFTIDNGTTSGPTVVLSGFTISGGKVSGGIAPSNSGGGIYNNHGTLTVANSLLKNNSATNGGALCNDGSLSVNAILALSDSTITNNTASGGGGGLFNNGSNGGSAPITISNSVFTGNNATSGGAILNDGHAGGSATITEFSNSVLNANAASGNGGGINNDGRTGGSATLVISYSTVSSNTAVNGGGIHNDGTGGSATQAITYSTFNANTASANGGAFNNDGRNAGSATLTVATSTLHGNTAAKGSAILNDGTGAGGSATVEIDNSTLKSNTVSGNSAAIDSDGTAGSATLALGSTILDNGPSDNLTLTTNSETTFTSKNHNLSSDEAGGNSNTGPGGPYLSAGGDIRNTDPMLDLAGLKDNGGPTKTIALRTGSPAIDQALSGSSTDQRGESRPYDNPAIVNASGGDGSDIGAYELQAPGILSLSVNDISVTETNGGSAQAQFTITLSTPSSQTVTVSVKSASGGSPEATPGTDYTALAPTTVTFAPGQTSKTVSVTILGDTLDENDEKFALVLSGAVNATIGDSTGLCTIIDNDAAPSISSSALNVTEGNAGTVVMTFTIKLSAASARNISVQYQTANGTLLPATAGSDYTAVPLTTVIFAAGQTTKTVNVTIKGDTLDEDNERIALALSNPVNTVIGTSTDGVIVDDDTSPSLSINNQSVTEGNTAQGAPGTKLMTFTLTLSAASGRTVTVTAQTGNGGSPAATAGTDYVALAPTTVSLTPGQTTRQISVTIKGDTIVESNEILAVLLSGVVNATLSDNSGVGTILNDDAAAIAAPLTAPADEDAST